MCFVHWWPDDSSITMAQSTMALLNEPQCWQLCQTFIQHRWKWPSQRLKLNNHARSSCILSSEIERDAEYGCSIWLISQRRQWRVCLSRGAFIGRRASHKASSFLQSTIENIWILTNILDWLTISYPVSTCHLQGSPGHRLSTLVLHTTRSLE